MKHSALGSVVEKGTSNAILSSLKMQSQEDRVVKKAFGMLAFVSQGE